MKVYGVSFDDAASHVAFRTKHNLPFPLVVDDGKIADAFQVPHLVGFAKRQSILIGTDGTIRKIWRSVDPATHASDVVDAARKP